MPKFALVVDVDGDWVYIPEFWSRHHPQPTPLLFDTLEEALEEREEWRNAVVVDYPSMEIRPMSEDERNRARERQDKNGHR